MRTKAPGSTSKSYTVTGLCRCGCDDAFVEHVEAREPISAAKKALRERRQPGTVVAVFEGHIQSLLGELIANEGAR